MKEIWDTGRVCRKCNKPYWWESRVCQKCGSRLDLCCIKYINLFVWYKPSTWNKIRILEYKDYK
jgi:predicted amidophosphoribosyltransferase